MDGVAPQGEAHADMVGKLGHQERLAHLGRSRKEVRPRVEQTVNDWRSALVDIPVKLIQDVYKRQYQIKNYCIMQPV